MHRPSATRGHTLKALRVVADRSGARAVGVDDAKRQRAQRRTNRVQHAAKGPRAQHSRRQRQRRERVTDAEHRNGEREIRKFTLRINFDSTFSRSASIASWFGGSGADIIVLIKQKQFYSW